VKVSAESAATASLPTDDRSWCSPSVDSPAERQNARRLAGTAASRPPGTHASKCHFPTSSDGRPAARRPGGASGRTPRISTTTVPWFPVSRVLDFPVGCPTRSKVVAFLGGPATTYPAPARVCRRGILRKDPSRARVGRGRGPRKVSETPPKLERYHGRREIRRDFFARFVMRRAELAIEPRRAATCSVRSTSHPRPGQAGDVGVGAAFS